MLIVNSCLMTDHLRFLFVFKQVFGIGKASGLLGVLTVTDEAVPKSSAPYRFYWQTSGDGLVELRNNTLKDAG